MDFFDLVFGGGQAIQGIFRLGFIPKEETLESFLVKNIKSSRRKSVIFVARCTHSSLVCQSLNMMFMSSSEEEKGIMLKGVEIIDSLCEEKTFISDDAKLRFVATVLPGVFSEGTKYACKQE